MVAFSLFLTELGMNFFALLLYDFDGIERIFGRSMSSLITENWSLGERLRNRWLAIPSSVPQVRLL
jgi:hypothetical protein